MNSILAILSFSLLVSLKSSGQSSKFDFSYAIFFGRNFESDTISVKVNGTQIDGRYVITSSKMLNMARELTIRQTSKGVIVFYKGKETLKPKIKHSNLMSIELTVNRETTTFQIDISRGQILLFNISKPLLGLPIGREVSMEQHREALIII